MTVIDFSNAFKNVLSQRKNAKKNKKNKNLFHCLFKHQCFLLAHTFFRHCWGTFSPVSFSHDFFGVLWKENVNPLGSTGKPVYQRLWKAYL